MSNIQFSIYRFDIENYLLIESLIIELLKIRSLYFLGLFTNPCPALPISSPSNPIPRPFLRDRPDDEADDGASRYDGTETKSGEKRSRIKSPEPRTKAAKARSKKTGRIVYPGNSDGRK